MAVRIGSIFVEMVANTAQFLTGMDKASIAAKKTGKDIRSGVGEVSNALGALGPIGAQIGAVLQTVGNKASAVFDSVAAKGRGMGGILGGIALGGVTALAAGMFGLAEHAAAFGAKVYDASQKTGIASGQISALMVIARETGGDFNSLATGLARAGANLEKTRESGGKANAILWQMMGGAQGVSELGLKPLGDRIQIVLGHIFRLQDAGQRNLALTQLLGRGWMDNVTSLRVLAEQGYAPATAEAKRFGQYIDDAHAEQAKKFAAALDLMKSRAAALTLVIGAQLIPIAEKAMVVIVGMIATISKLVDNLKWLAVPGLGPAIAFFKGIHDSSSTATQAMTDFLTQVDAVTAGIKGTDDVEGKLIKTHEKHAQALKELKERLTEADKEMAKFQELLARSQVMAQWGHGAPGAPPELAIPGLAPLPAQTLGLPGLPAGPSRLAEDFHNAFLQMQHDGDDFTGHLSNSMYTLVSGWEEGLAHMAVTGKANFKSLYMGIEESLLKAGLQKGVSGLLGKIGVGGGLSKPDGSQGNPLWVRMAGGAGAAATATMGGATETGKTIGGLFSRIGSFFGGFLQEGGSVMPGRAYVVGEQHPEFFIPHASGTVVPRVAAQTLRPINYAPTYHINTPDADSFRRSHSQIASEGYRAIASIHARNS